MSDLKSQIKSWNKFFGKWKAALYVLHWPFKHFSTSKEYWWIVTFFNLYSLIFICIAPTHNRIHLKALYI